METYELGGLGAAFWIGILIAVLVYLVLTGLFLLSVYNCLKEVSPKNRRMSPGLVWLGLIPFFNYIWNFFIVIRVADSLADDFHERGVHVEEYRPGYSVGMAFCILSLVRLLPIPVISFAVSIAVLICWIVYWAKIYQFKRKLQNSMPLDGGNNRSMSDVLDSGL